MGWSTNVPPLLDFIHYTRIYICILIIPKTHRETVYLVVFVRFLSISHDLSFGYIDHFVMCKQLYYCVDWLSYGLKNQTWELNENLTNAKDSSPNERDNVMSIYKCSKSMIEIWTLLLSNSCSCLKFTQNSFLLFCLIIHQMVNITTENLGFSDTGKGFWKDLSWCMQERKRNQWHSLTK